MHDAIVRSVFYCGMVLVGAAAWITMERLHVVRPMCTLDSSIYADAVERPTGNR